MLLLPHGGAAQDRKPTLHGCVLAIRQKRGTAKVNDPDAWGLGASFNEDVFQLNVPVEHTSRVDLDKCVHQLFYDDLCRYHCETHQKPRL